MASPARHLFLVAVVAVLAVAAEAWGGGRFFFSKTTRDEAAAVEPEKAAAAGASGTTTPGAAAADPNAAPAFSSRPSTGGSGRGYGLYGRPEENYPPDYFRRGVHRNAEKLTTTTDGAGREASSVPVGGEERAREYPADGSGRGRPTTTTVPATTTSDAEEAEATPAGGAAGGDLEGAQPYPEDGSGRGRPPWYYTGFRGGRQQRGYGMSDTRLYQNGRYYYDVDASRYGYGRESNPMRARPEEEYPGSGYGRPAGGDRSGKYGNNNAAAGYYRRYGGNDDEFGNGAVEQSTNGFQEEEGRQNGRYTP